MPLRRWVRFCPGVRETRVRAQRRRNVCAWRSVKRLRTIQSRGHRARLPPLFHHRKFRYPKPACQLSTIASWIFLCNLCGSQATGGFRSVRNEMFIGQSCPKFSEPIYRRKNISLRQSPGVLVDADNYKHCAATRLVGGKNSILSHLVSSFDSAATPRTHLPIPSSYDAQPPPPPVSPTNPPCVRPRNPTLLRNPSYMADRKRSRRTTGLRSLRAFRENPTLPDLQRPSHYYQWSASPGSSQSTRTSCASDRQREPAPPRAIRL